MGDAGGIELGVPFRVSSLPPAAKATSPPQKPTSMELGWPSEYCEPHGSAILVWRSPHALYPGRGGLRGIPAAILGQDLNSPDPSSRGFLLSYGVWPTEAVGSAHYRQASSSRGVSSPSTHQAGGGKSSRGYLSRVAGTLSFSLHRALHSTSSRSGLVSCR